MSKGKYKRLYRFLEPHHVLPTIQSQKLKISLFDQLNDPHELLAAHLNMPQLKDVTEFLIERNKRMMWLLCWCESYSRAVMWAHYADRHKGAALGFDVATLGGLQKVKYTRTPMLIDVDEWTTRELTRWRLGEIKLNMKIAKGIDKYLRKVFSTRNADWVYEDEWRSYTTITDAENGLYFKPFKPGPYLREVVLGLRCKLSIEDIRKALASLPGNVEVLRAHAQGHGFDLKGVLV